MKVKMLENVQGNGIEGVHLPDKEQAAILHENESYRVSESLGAWLLEHHKAVRLDDDPPHYGAQAEPTERHDDEAEAEVAVVLGDESDVMSTKRKRRSK